MTTSKTFRLGFGTVIVLLGLCVLTLLVRWPSAESLGADPNAILRDTRFSFGLALALLVVAGASAVVTGVAIRRSLVTTQQPMSENSETHDRRSAEAAGFGAYSYDLERQTADWSAAIKKIHGLPADAVVSHERVLELIHPNDREHFHQRLTGMFSPTEGEPYECEFRIVRPDGDVRWLHDRGQFTFAGSGRSRRPVRALGMVWDITERKRGEALQQDSEVRHRAAFEGSAVGMYLADPVTDHLLRVNHRFCQMLGYSNSELVNLPCQDILHIEDRDSMREGLNRLRRGEISEYRDEKRYVRKEGGFIWGDVTVNLVQDLSGRSLRTVAVIKDITARKEIEESLRESGERLRLANEAANIGTYFGDIESDRVRYSSELCAMLEVEVGIERTMEDGFQFVQPEDLRQLRTDFNAAINPAGDGRQRTEVRIIRPNGEVRWLVTNAQIEFRDTPAGRVPWRVVGACLDITERKRTEISLRQLNDELEDRVAERTRVLYAKQERLQAIFNSNFDAILTIDRRGLVESVNLAAVKMFGDSVDGMIGQDFNRFVPPPEGQSQDGTGRNYLQIGLARMPGYSLEVVARRKDGSTFPADLAVSEIAHLGLYCSILRDLSEHKRLEREVAEATAYEQRRIGQDLHDSVGQQLTAMTMLAQDFVELLGADSQISNSHPLDSSTPPPKLSHLSPSKLAERLRRDLQKALEEVRSISRNLNPVPIDSQGLMVALADLVERMQLQSRVICSFDCAIPVVIEDNVTATHLFHIAQEALSNALRHARAHEIRISLRQDDLQIALRIQDDGVGVSWSLPKSDGIGQRIMKSRADMIGATLSIDRAEPKGTIVTCNLPNGTKHRD